MAARILPFRSLVPGAKPVLISSVSGSLDALYSAAASRKVLTMSHQARQRAALQASHANNDLYAKVEREINAGYLEVEITGISLRRFVAAYRVLARGAWAYALGSVRSLVRPTPAL